MTTPGPVKIYCCSSCSNSYAQRTIATGNNIRARYRSDGKLDAPMLQLTPPLVVCPICRHVEQTSELVLVAKYYAYLGFVPRGEHHLHEELARKYLDTPWLEVPTADECLEYVHGCDLGDGEVALRLFTLQRINDQRLGELSALVWASKFERIKALRAQGDRRVGRWEFNRLANAFRAGKLPVIELDDLLKFEWKCSPIHDGHCDNLIQLLRLLELSSAKDTGIMRAEILRELGEFDAALEVLACEHAYADGGRAEQLLLACEVECAMPFTYAQGFDHEEYEYDWQLRHYRPENDLESKGVDYPPVFHIGNRDWWVKVLGMLHHNWVLIDGEEGGPVTVYFFCDGGLTKSPTGYSLKQLRGRCAIVDSVGFNSLAQAQRALTKDGFSRLALTPGPWLGETPKGLFFDARSALSS